MYNYNSNTVFVHKHDLASMLLSLSTFVDEEVTQDFIIIFYFFVHINRDLQQCFMFKNYQKENPIKSF